jgi:MoaA/NifB/PqqE/SkfB family radical SAM enzyme
MKIQTFSIVVGTKACNAKCPFCVSRMTGFDPVIGKTAEINEINFAKACLLAKLGGSTTVLMTGKGEPTLYPLEITTYLKHLVRHEFPLIEIQTNAMLFGQLARGETPKIKDMTRDEVAKWRDLGLNTIAISNVGHEQAWNQRIYGDGYGDLAPTMDWLHDMGFTIRLCTMLQKECVDDTSKLQELLEFCRQHGVEQLTVRPIRKPASTKDGGASTFVEQYGLEPAQEAEIARFIRAHGTLIATMMHGAEVFDFHGQNLCLSDCLTVNKTGDDIRTLIFYSDGRLTYDWQYEGAVILGGSSTKKASGHLPVIAEK